MWRLRGSSDAVRRPHDGALGPPGVDPIPARDERRTRAVGSDFAAAPEMNDEDPRSSLPTEGELFDGKYEIGSVLGIGGMAAVLAARHLGLDEMVAIKILLPDCCDDPAVVERFVQEGKTAIKIRSEHVVRMMDVGVVDGRAYLVMEHLDGTDLDLYVRKSGPLPISEAVDLVLQACEAIAEAHVLGIVHRDLKPANLFLTRRADGSPCVKVLDFGISKIPRGAAMHTSRPQPTLPSMVMGSPQYMSPEQLTSAAKADPRSDIWSLGTVLYELLTGRLAFGGSTVTAVCARVLQGTPEPLLTVRPEAQAALSAVLARCFEKEAAARYPTVAYLASALAPFGTAGARASAESIARVMGRAGEGPEGDGAARGSRPSVITMKPTAAEILATVPRRRRAISGYLVGTLLVTVSAAVIVTYSARMGRSSPGSPVDVAAAGRASAPSPPPESAVVAPSPPPLVSAPSGATSASAPPTHASMHAAVPRTPKLSEAEMILAAADAGLSDDDVGPYDAPADSNDAP
jgi:hypothetical protein